MEKKCKKILKVQPWYSIIICFIISICGGTMLFLPKILSWEKNMVGTQIIYYIIAVLFIVIGVLLALRFMEYAVIIEDKIIIYSPFGKIGSYKKEKIRSIKKEKLITYDSRGYISLQWIVIKTDSSLLKKGRINKKGNTFCQIIASPKNISVLKQYADYYHIPFE